MLKVRLLGIDDRHFLEHIRRSEWPRTSQAAKIILSTPSVEDRFSKMIVRSRRLPVPWVLYILCPLFAVGEFVEGQSGTLTTEENFRAQQNGILLGQLRAGMSLEVLEATDDWLQFDLDGWIWDRSLQAVDRGRFDLVVSVEGGENIRGAPNGEVLGHLEQGTLLETVERVPGWIRVRRRAWVWRRSVALFGADPSGDSAERSGFTMSSSVIDGGEWALGSSANGTILSAPDGDTLAISAPSTNLRVLAREGNWARVRLEGWIWLPENADGGFGASVRVDVTLANVMAAPDDYRGEVLQWDLQFISLERAEEIRTDFYAMEPFLLTRMRDGDEGFVYVAVPPERLAEARGLIPLERIRVLGRCTDRVRSADRQSDSRIAFIRKNPLGCWRSGVRPHGTGGGSSRDLPCSSRLLRRPAAGMGLRTLTRRISV